MKKVLAVVLCAGLIGGALIGPAYAGKKKKKKAPPAPQRIERTIDFQYIHPGLGIAPLGGFEARFPEGGEEIATTATDLYIKVDVTDAAGQKVAGFISQGDLDGNGINDDGYAAWCGAHPSPVPLAAPGSPIVGFYMYNGVCDDASTPSIMTTGTVKITFSNMP